MKKTLLAIFVSTILTTSAFAVENDSTSGMSSENMFCRVFKISCNKVENDGTSGKTDNSGVGGKSKDHGSEEGIPLDGQLQASASGAPGGGVNLRIRGQG